MPRACSLPANHGIDPYDARLDELCGPGTATLTDLCWGQKVLDRVVKWEGPMKLGDYQEALVVYTYKIDKLADWAKNPELQAGFPHIKTMMEGAGTREQRHGVKLTSAGWEAKGLD